MPFRILTLHYTSGKKEDTTLFYAAICSSVGDTGVYVFGATGEKGLKVNGFYLLQWHMIQWMKENGVHYYDLGVFNPELNPGVYIFKKGLAGKKGLGEDIPWRALWLFQCDRSNY